MRLDRVVLSIWTMGGAYAAALCVYGAALLLCEAFRIGDVRPLAVLLSAVVVTAALLLREADGQSVPALPWTHRIGWLIALLPFSALFKPQRAGGRICAG